MNTLSFGGAVRTFAAVAAASMVLAAPVSAASLLINGSFETGVPGNTRGLNNNALFSDLNSTGPSWDRWRAIDGWTTVSGSGIEVQSNRTLSTIDAQDGSHYVELDSNSNSRMVQNVALKAGSYLLSFWYSPRTPGASTNPIEYNLGGIVGGKVTSGTLGAQVGTWTQILQTVVIKTAGNYNLFFAAAGISDSYGGLIDNAELAPVPLPAAGFGLMAALGGLAALKRRRRA